MGERSLTPLRKRVLMVLANYDHLSRDSIARHADTTRAQAQRTLNTLYGWDLVNQYPTRADHWCVTDHGRRVIGKPLAAPTGNPTEDNQ